MLNADVRVREDLGLVVRGHQQRLRNDTSVDHLLHSATRSAAHSEKVRWSIQPVQPSRTLPTLVSAQRRCLTTDGGSLTVG